MSESPTYPNRVQSVEEGVNTLLCNAQQCIREKHQECEASIRKSPNSAMLIALATGYCLNRLPVRAILVTQVRLLSALAPPALFLFGAAKVCEYLQSQNASKPR